MNDADWLDNVKRWYFSGDGQPGSPTWTAARRLPTELGDDDEIGYEAAHPALQAADWPDAGDTIR